MPSPIGHAIAGVAGGWLVARPARGRRPALIQAGWLAVVGMAADLDLLWGRHSRETHSVGAAFLAAAAAIVTFVPVGTTRTRIFFAVLAAWLTHPLLDVFAVDNAAPFGVMLWWPFSDDFVHAARPIFDPISRAWTSLAAWQHDLLAASREALWLLPLCLLVWLLRRPGKFFARGQ